MKDEAHIDDELLGRWLSGEMSAKELDEFKASDSFKTYQLIAEYGDNLEAPAFDENTAYTKLKEERNSQKGKIVRMRKFRWIAAAASVVILLGIGSMFLFTGNSVEHQISLATLDTETKNITLPSNSTVKLNVSSSIKYDEESWKDERLLHLEGEAYFNVTKGKAFRVETNTGTIEVLGTEFNIRERNDILEIICFSGKVKVTDQQQKSVVLTRGLTARIVEGVLEADWSPELETKPSWMTGESSFYNAPLENVILELEMQYGIRIERSEDYGNRVYSGAFTHESIVEAAKMVFLPMQIDYEIQNDSLIVID